MGVSVTPRAELVVSLVERMQPCLLYGRWPGGPPCSCTYGGPGGHQFTERHCPCCPRSQAGKRSPLPQQAGTPCRLLRALCILKRPVSYSEWGPGEGHSRAGLWLVPCPQDREQA